MASLNTKIQNIAPSATNAMAALAKQIKDEGNDVVSLAIGEPGFSTPNIVKQAGIDAINTNVTKYTNVDGLKELREAIVSRYKREYGADFKADQVCVTSGAKHSLHNIFNCILEEGDEAIFFAPYWVSYPAMISLSRLYVLQHFPMDVIGGTVIGVMFAGVMANRTKLYQIFDKSKT